MEIHSKSTVFVLACNTPEKIIEPIQSRCTKLTFRPLSENDIINRIKYIAEKENINIKDEGIKAIEIVSEGDMRKAINALQTCSVCEGEITKDEVYQRNDLPSADNVSEAIKSCLNGKYDDALEKVKKIQKMGFDGNDIIDMIVRMFSKIDVSEDVRVKLYETASPFLIHKVNSEIQLYGLLAKLTLLKL